MKLIKETYISWGAEVVFITSNLQGNQEMMEGCKAAGIPAFVRNLPSSCDSTYDTAPECREHYGISDYLVFV